MTQTSAGESGGPDDSTGVSATSEGVTRSTGRAPKGRIAGLMLFLRQVVSEIKKVVRPTRKELLTYTSVVLVFVLVVMTYVSILDFGFRRLVGWAFASD